MYDGNTVILELDGNGAEKARNVYGRNLIARESDGEKAIYRYNGHGDVIALNAPNGDMIAEYAYDEFGQVIEEQAAPQATPMVDIDFSVEGSEEYDFPEDAIFDNPYRYAGYEYLDEVELYDLNARYYDPSIARFLTEDPYYNLGNRVMGVYEINVPDVYSIMQANALYAYCGNNPIIFIDPSGLDYYVFYGEDQEWAAEQYEKQLKKDYSDVPVHMVSVDTPDTFYTEWNNMGTVDGETVSIDGVIVNLHGNPTNIYASDGNEIDIGELTNDSKIETMLLLSCNAGHMDYENNMAVQFLKAANIGNVIAPDGTHYRDEFKGIFGLWANVKSIVKADETFKKYAIDKDRSSTGFVSFSLNSLGQVAYNFNVLDSINENEIRAVDLFKHKHFFASPYEEGLR